MMNFIYRLGDFIERLVEQHQLVRRLLLVWFMYFASLILFRAIAAPEITMEVATIFTTFLGFFTIIVGIYQWNRGKKDNAND